MVLRIDERVEIGEIPSVIQHQVARIVDGHVNDRTNDIDSTSPTFRQVCICAGQEALLRRVALDSLINLGLRQEVLVIGQQRNIIIGLQSSVC